MTSVAPSDYAFYEFPARSYLEKYYGGVGPENAAFARSITDYVTARTVRTDTVIEVGGGPCLFSLLSLMACRGRPFDHVTFTDIGWKNLREVDCWLRDEPSQFRYGSLLRWLSDELGADRTGVSRALRKSAWELASFDWREPVPPVWRHAYDVVSSHFFAESATTDETEMIALLAKLNELGRPGATLLTSYLCRSAGYTVGRRQFPAVSVDEGSILGYLERAGLELEDVQVRSVPCEGLAPNSGYEGLLFVAARLSAGHGPSA